MTHLRYALVAEAGSYSLQGQDVPLRRSIPPDHPIYAQIGRVVAQAAHWEHLLARLVLDLQGVPRSEGGARAQPGPADSLRKAIHHARERSLPESLLQALMIAEAEAQGLADRRNQIVHGPAYVGEGGEIERSAATKQELNAAIEAGSPRFGFIGVSETELETLRIDLVNATSTAHELRECVRQALKL